MNLGDDKIYTISFARLESIDEGLIGMTGSVYKKILQAGINLPQGFILTTSAFDNFLIANDLVSEIDKILKTIVSSKFEEIEKASKEIGQLFKNTVIPPSIYESLQEAFDAISGLHGINVSIKTSWKEGLHIYSGDIESEYEVENIYSIDDLENKIKEIWQVLFDPKSIFERIENNYSGPLTISVIIQKSVNSEVSGISSSINPLTKNNDEIEIEAILGMYKGIDKLNLVPDRYVVSKDGWKIIEKNSVSQAKMLVRSGFIQNPDKSSEIAIPISRPWQLRQKINDFKIQEIAQITASIESMLGKEIQMKWGISTGKIYVIDVKTKKSLEINENNINRGNLITNPIEIIPADQMQEEVNVDNYINEIEAEINSIDNSLLEVEEQSDSIPQIASKIKKTDQKVTMVSDLPLEAEKTKEEKNEVVELEFPSLWSRVLFSPKEKGIKTASEIWLDLEEEMSLREMNSNVFAGLYGVRGENFIEGFGVQKLAENESAYSQLEYYITEQLYELISKDFSKHVIYSLLDRNSDLFDTLDFDKMINIELEAIKNIRNKRGFRKIWVSIRGVREVGELKKIKKIISSAGIKRSSMFKVYLELDKLPLFLNIADYLDENVDGVILYIDEIFREMFGAKVKVEELLSNEIFWDLLAKLSKEISSRGINYLIKSSVISENEVLLEKLLNIGISGFCMGGKKMSKMVDLLQTTEVGLLKKKKRK